MQPYAPLRSPPSPFAAASRLMSGVCIATAALLGPTPPIATSPPRVLPPLPSKTQGPALFRGVIGPSGPPMRVGLTPVGDGVLVPSLSLPLVGVGPVLLPRPRLRPDMPRLTA